MLNLTLQDILIRAAAYVLVAAISGLAARLLLKALKGKGDSEFRFFDIVGMLGAILFKQGWGRSAQPEAGGMVGGRLGLVAWVVLTLAVTLLVVAFLPYARTPLASFGTNVFTQGAIAVLNATADIGVWFVIISAIPLPPLLGGNLLIALFPQLKANARKFYWPGTAIVALLVGLGFAEAALKPVFTLLRGWVA